MFGGKKVEDPRYPRDGTGYLAGLYTFLLKLSVDGHASPPKLLESMNALEAISHINKLVDAKEALFLRVIARLSSLLIRSM